MVNMVMKSGTNSFHGSVYDYIQNEALNAGNPFTNNGSAGLLRPELRRNDYGLNSWAVRPGFPKSTTVTTRLFLLRLGAIHSEPDRIGARARHSHGGLPGSATLALLSRPRKQNPLEPIRWAIRSSRTRFTIPLPGKRSMDRWLPPHFRTPPFRPRGWTRFLSGRQSRSGTLLHCRRRMQRQRGDQ